MAIILLVDGNTYEFPEKNEDPNWAGDVTAWAKAITDKSNLTQSVTGVLSTPILTLFSGSVTYNSALTKTYTVIKSNTSVKEITMHVSIVLTNKSSPQNPTMSIPLVIPAASGIAGIHPNAAVRVKNVTVTGQVYAHVEPSGTSILLTAVNNGAETSLSATTALQTNSEFHFTLTYLATP